MFVCLCTNCRLSKGGGGGGGGFINIFSGCFMNDSWNSVLPSLIICRRFSVSLVEPHKHTVGIHH